MKEPIVLNNRDDFIALYERVQRLLKKPAGTLDGQLLTDLEGHTYFREDLTEAEAKEAFVENFPLKDALENEAFCKIMRAGTITDETERRQALTPFECIIDQDVAFNPVLTIKGSAGSRGNFERWFKGNSVDPKTGEKLDPKKPNSKNLIPNQALLALLRIYLDCDLKLKKEIKDEHDALLKDHDTLLRNRDQMSSSLQQQENRINAMTRNSRLSFLFSGISFFGLAGVASPTLPGDKHDWTPLIIRASIFFLFAIAMGYFLHRGIKLFQQRTQLDGTLERAQLDGTLDISSMRQDLQDAEAALLAFRGGLFGRSEETVIPIEADAETNEVTDKTRLLDGDSETIQYGALDDDGSGAQHPSFIVPAC